MKRKWLFIMTVLLIGFSFTNACAPKSPDAPAEIKLKVVTSIFPLTDFVINIGREKVEVITLIPAGANPETYEPKPRQIREIAKAKVFIKNGAGLEFWIEKVVKEVANPDLIIVDSSKGVTFIRDEFHEHEVNPHIWLDPILAQQQVRNITQALIQADPVNKDFYEKNSQQYLAELEALDKKIREVVNTFSIREFIAFHPTWTYFAKRYGLVEAAVIETAPGEEPSPAHIKEVIDTAKKLRVRAIFVEPQFSPKAAQRIAEEVGIKVLFLDSLGGPEIKGRDSYLKLMMYNLEQMKQAMGR